MYKTKSFQGMQIAYENLQELDCLLAEIFDGQIYRFSAAKPDPMIIDCGAHIGISVLYFKSLYPEAKICAFEPNPYNFQLLQENIKLNQLQSVECFPVALDNWQGKAALYGHFEDSYSSVGNSIRCQWGNRGHTSELEVNVARLSNYLPKGFIDYLKLDTEGTERNVIEDIAPHLQQVGQLFIEFHSCAGLDADYIDVVSQLARQGFSERVIDQQQLSKLTSSSDAWLESNQPEILQAIFKR
ncbi:FkbM family methyltransferase [Pedobacter aquatilis]|uniref:FkbM family methyltransferase n=1 Tax=Pedobacter aquatilis TaxID=351343 RepID=UPI002930C15A|nr:FkbM family methyltransferase [Pedobacter aquatilis]